MGSRSLSLLFFLFWCFYIPVLYIVLHFSLVQSQHAPSMWISRRKSASTPLPSRTLATTPNGSSSLTPASCASLVAVILVLSLLLSTNTSTPHTPQPISWFHPSFILHSLQLQSPTHPSQGLALPPLLLLILLTTALPPWPCPWPSWYSNPLERTLSLSPPLPQPPSLLLLSPPSLSLTHTLTTTTTNETTQPHNTTYAGRRRLGPISDLCLLSFISLVDNFIAFPTLIITAARLIW